MDYGDFTFGKLETKNLKASRQGEVVSLGALVFLPKVAGVPMGNLKEWCWLGLTSKMIFLKTRDGLG